MLAVTAAHITLPARIKGTRHVDIYEVRTIQCRSAILKLSEMIRVVGVLERNLEKRQDKRRAIIPLVNYLLSLCEGPIFTVNPILRKRFSLLSEFKVCKRNEVNPTFSGLNLEYDMDFAPLIIDLSQLKENIYNSNLQRKILGCLKSISQNALAIYDKKLKQIVREKSLKPVSVDPFIDEVPLEYEAIDDLLKPYEVDLFLDLAVLINDRVQDTSSKSLRKLHFQVLAKVLSSMNDTVFPTMKTYFNQLQRVYNNKGPAVPNVKELPHWRFTAHRLYSYVYRILCILDVIISLARKLWFPNKDYFHSLTSQLLCENLYTYRELLVKVDSMCNDPKLHTGLIITILDDWSKPNLNINVNSSTVSEIFANSICKVSSILRSTLEVVNSWSEAWKYIDNNAGSLEKLADSNEEQLSNMLQKKLTMDKLALMEGSQKMSRLNPEIAISPPVGSGHTVYSSRIQRGRARRLEASTLPSISGSATASDKISPLTTNRGNSADRPNTRGKIPGSLQISRKNSVDMKIHSPILTSRSGSLRIPRKGSITEGGSAASINMNNTADRKNASQSFLENKTNEKIPACSPYSSYDDAIKISQKTSLKSPSDSLRNLGSLGQNRLQDGFLVLRINGSSNISTCKDQQMVRTRNEIPLYNDLQGSDQIEDFKNTTDISFSNIHLPKSIEFKERNEKKSDGQLLLGRRFTAYPERKEREQNPEKAPPLDGYEEFHQEHNNSVDFELMDGRTKGSEYEKPEDEEPKKRNQLTGLRGREGQSSAQQMCDFPSTQRLHNNSTVIQKKVRFVGVGPIAKDELGKPVKKGWQRRSAGLHYPHRSRSIRGGDSAFVKKA